MILSLIPVFRSSIESNTGLATVCEQWVKSNELMDSRRCPLLVTPRLFDVRKVCTLHSGALTPLRFGILARLLG